MKKLIILISSLAVIGGGITAYAMQPETCCGATCTGSKSCTACKNCKYCKHCAKQGGTCGVCK